MTTLKVLNVAGARPNFMKIAPLMREMIRRGDCEPQLVHTGQHYDEALSDVFFDELSIPPPMVNLEVGSGSRAEQISLIIERFTPVIERLQPDLVLVVGDVNSTVACARVAKQFGVAVAHVEAGLRSFDRRMPEEVNRIETDQLADFLFVTEESGMHNLQKEQVEGQCYLVGNVMIDSLEHQISNVDRSELLQRLRVSSDHFFIGTFHRPSNVDARSDLEKVLEIIFHAAERMPIILPLHPRTRSSLTRHSLLSRLQVHENVRLTDPLGYLDFVGLMRHAKAVVTDSGGVQEETTYLGIPCITMRDSTERPVTVDLGTNVLAGTDTTRVISEIDNVLRGQVKQGSIPPLWDGHASERIVKILVEEFGQKSEVPTSVEA